MKKPVDLTHAEFHLVPADQEWSAETAIAGPCAHGGQLKVHGSGGVCRMAAVVDGVSVFVSGPITVQHGETIIPGNSLIGGTFAD